MENNPLDYEERLIVAYDQSDNFAGLFITYSIDDLTDEELLEIFEGRQPNYLIIAAVPEVEGLTVDNYMDQLEDLIGELRENNTSNLDIDYYIPKTLH